MDNRDHRIRSLRWQVGAHSAEEGFAWRTFLAAYGADLLAPVLEKGLDGLTSEGEVLRLPRLHLHLRLGSPAELVSALPEAIDRQLRKQAMAAAADAAYRARESTDQAAVARGVDPAATLIAYLRTGLLPWEAAAGAAQEQVTLLRTLVQQHWPRIVDHLGRQAEQPPFLLRLLHLIGTQSLPSALDHVVALVPAHRQGNALAVCVEAIQGESSGLSRLTRLQLLATLLAAVLDPAGATTAKVPLDQAMTAVVPSAESAPWQGLLASLPEAAASLLFGIGTPARPEDSPAATGTSGAAQPFSAPPSTDGPLHPEAESLPTDGRRPAGRPTPSRAVDRPEQLSAAEGPPEASPSLYPLRIDQAGVILLHPYIGRLLTHCGLADPGDRELAWPNLPRIANLLHYLATGRDEMMEFELGLIKVLIGLEPTTPLPLCDGLLTALDREETDRLLTAVIGHWEALKNTSVDGLRTSFLQRVGLLRRAETGWRLNVERQPHDVLLDRLPWSFSLVRLPWMDVPLTIEW